MELIYADNILDSYSENIIRGDGVLKIILDEDQSLEILNLDNSDYEVFKMLKDTYTMMYNSEKIIARRFIPNHDFFKIYFDCDCVNEDHFYIQIYINGEKKKIEKNKYQYIYQTWEEFLLDEYVGLIANNLLIVKNEKGDEPLIDSINETFKVDKVEDDTLWLTSTSTGCCKSLSQIEGYLKWKKDNRLLIDLNIFD